MPWFKCSHCRIRRSGLDVAISAAQDRCPLCGRTLECERDLTSLVGLRFLTNDPLPATAAADLPSLPDAFARATGSDAPDEGGRGAPEL